MIFVTGGTGVLGTQLLFDLTTDKTPIRALYRSKKKKNQTLRFFLHFDSTNGQKRFDLIEWVTGNILDIPALTEAMRGCSHIYHCAAKVSFDSKDYFQLMEINREGTANIVNVGLLLNIEKLCYVSSTAAIGGSDNKTITEQTKWKNSPTTTGYSISKYSAEKEVWRGIEEGLDAVMINPCVILGAGNWNDSSLTIFRTVQKGMRYYPPGKNAIVDARDVSNCMIQLMNSTISKERFLCTGSNQSFQELMTTIADVLEVKAPKKLVKRWMVSAARRLLRFGSWLTGKRPSITKETVDSLFSERTYDSSKIKKALNVKFHDLRSTVEFSVNGRIH